MATLIERLGARLAALHVEQLTSLHAQAPRLANADTLAQRLQNAGINAHPEGRIRDDGTVSIWIHATADAPRIRAALDKLDITERDDTCTADSGLICVAGDVPVYAFPPIVYPTTAE